MRFHRRQYSKPLGATVSRNLNVVRERYQFCHTHKQEYQAPVDGRTGQVLSPCPRCVEDQALYQQAVRDLSDLAAREGRDRRTITHQAILELAEQRAGKQLLKFRAHG
ncbi:hypothetical protein [Dyella japonica]|uniref:Uncharacterized protein n=1 Tax=Dyella japonica DSM 16301 TaxID=1440762 RepID=A0A0G9H861_9GAMM|nr:hypothetical protein [Dyella japonica]KLD65444.1 hypothetical protein Y882_02690 [Dyella japonica DSM 16301]